MRLQVPVFGLLVIASSVAAFPGAEAHRSLEAQSGDGNSCGAPGEACDKVKRAALAINGILKRHAESEPFCSKPDSYCEKQRESLGRIAEVALDGYDQVNSREAKAEAEAEPKKKASFFSYCSAPGSTCIRTRDTNVKEEDGAEDLVAHCSEPGSFCAAKRTASPEERRITKRCALCNPFLGCPASAQAICTKIRNDKWHRNHPHYWKNHPNAIHPIHLKTGESTYGSKPLFGNWCGAPGSNCIKKRNAEPQDVAEGTKIGETLYAIRDAVDTIKREAEDEQENRDRTGSPDDLSSQIQTYFDELEARIRESMMSLEE